MDGKVGGYLQMDALWTQGSVEIEVFSRTSFIYVPYKKIQSTLANPESAI